MAKTEVILTSNIVGLGAESDQVSVAAGYARNYLIPYGLAIPLTAANKKRLEALRRRRAEREAQELNAMTELAKSLSKLICVIKVKTGEDGKMFGSVTSGTIADELKQQFDITLDKKKIHLEQPIRNLGEYEVEMRLHPDVKTTLKVVVESQTPLPQPPAPPPAAEQAPKTEKRSRKAAERAAAEPGAKQAAAAAKAAAPGAAPAAKPGATAAAQPKKAKKASPANPAQGS
jgi:large subunit ribosomal protein L9